LLVSQSTVHKRETLAQIDTLLSATTKTLTNKTLTSPVINTAISGTAIDTDGTLAANSDTKVCSQKAVKAYAQPLDTFLTALAALGTAANKLLYSSGVNTAAELALTANTFAARSSAGNIYAAPVTNIALSFLSDTTGIAASTAEIKTGTVAAKYAAPDKLLAALGFTGYYQTSDQAITSAGALTIAHGLGRTPVLVAAFLKCTDAGGEDNYAQNDVLATSFNADIADALSRGVSIVCDATNINIRFGSNANAFAVLDKTTGTASSITNSKWALIVRVWA